MCIDCSQSYSMSNRRHINDPLNHCPASYTCNHGVNSTRRLKLRWIYFKLDVYFSVTVDLPVVIRNNMEKSSLSLTHFLPKVISCKNIVQYKNQNIRIDKIHLYSSDFPNFSCIHLWYMSI